MRAWTVKKLTEAGRCLRWQAQTWKLDAELDSRVEELTLSEKQWRNRLLRRARTFTEVEQAIDLWVGACGEARQELVSAACSGRRSLC